MPFSPFFRVLQIFSFSGFFASSFNWQYLQVSLSFWSCQNCFPVTFLMWWFLISSVFFFSLIRYEWGWWITCVLPKLLLADDYYLASIYEIVCVVQISFYINKPYIKRNLLNFVFFCCIYLWRFLIFRVF